MLLSLSVLLPFLRLSRSSAVLFLVLFLILITPVNAGDLAMPYALNVGGAEYTDLDGVKFAQDVSNERVVTLAKVNGTQNPTIYQSLRQGDQAYAIKLASNEPQDVAMTLYFTEPLFNQTHQRRFDVVVEGEVVIPNLDLVRARSDSPNAAITRTLPNILVTDGVLNLELKGIESEPVLSGFKLFQPRQPETCGTEIWRDDFNAQQIDPQAWSFDVWPAGKVNSELQRYTDAPQNARLEDGHLVIEAIQEDTGFSSARLHTAQKIDTVYGRIEARAKVPAVKGTWPAIWMLPTDPFKYASNCESGTDWQGNGGCDAWPNSGEIDIMEFVGYDPRRVHATVHTKDYVWSKGSQRKGSVELPSLGADFHTYAVDWQPNKMVFYVDDVAYFTYHKQGEDWPSWPFDHPFHLIVNLAVGGGWGGAEGPPTAALFPVQFRLDWARVVDTSGCNHY